MRLRKVDTLILTLAALTALPWMLEELRRYPGLRLRGARRTVLTIPDLGGLPTPRLREPVRPWLEDHVSTLCLGREEDQPVLWVGTFEDGVIRIDPDHGSRRRLESPTASSAMINQIVQGRDRAWAATAGGVLELRGRRLRRWGADRGLPSEHVAALALSPGGDLWAGTGQGLAVKTRSARRFLRAAMERRHPITCLAWADGGLFVGSLRGLSLRKESRWRPLDPASDRGLTTDITALTGTEGGVLVGTYAHGIHRLNPEGDASSPDLTGTGLLAAGPARTARVNPGALAEVAGLLLVGTDGDGLLVGGRDGWSRIGPEHGLPSGNVSALAGRSLGVGTELWIGTRAGLARVVLEPEGEV